MTADGWRARAGTQFTCEKQPASGSRGMVVSNHPAASAAGASILAGGGNAVDAAIATLFALTVVEPMMVGMIGGGMAHLRLPDGTHTIIDGMSTVPGRGRADMFRPVSDAPGILDTEGRESTLGAKAVAVPGNLMAWCEMLSRFGSVSLEDAIAPAVQLAERGFTVTPYLSECIADAAADMAGDKAIAACFLPDGSPLKPGARLVRGDYAETLRQVAREGAGALYGGSLGAALAACIEWLGGVLSESDLSSYRTVERAPIRGSYRGWEILGPPPPASSGVHIAQMLNVLEGFDVAAMGFGTADGLHLLAEVLKIAFADRAAATADPAFVEVPVERLIDKEYAAERRAKIDMGRAQAWSAGVSATQSSYTTHMTAADRDGRIVAATQTINSLFGARFMVPGTGLIPNNYMATFDPNPGRAGSIAPGKRVTTSMSPMIALRDGKPVYALGLPGGLRIFPSAMQALINLIDHGMSLQEAVEAPRIWTQGLAVEVEAFAADAIAALRARGHEVMPMPHVGGGMNAIRFHGDGTMTGAACWRADGTAVGIGGGLARPGVRFWPDQARRA